MNEHRLTQIAREAIEAFLQDRKYEPPGLGRDEETYGIFVTLWSAPGSLRGCIGRHRREYDDLGREIADCAVRSAVEDPRFPAVRPGELAALRIEISLLGSPEAMVDLKGHDPRHWGLIIRKGSRQATLLPGIEGINTAQEQDRAIRSKAGIRPDEAVEYFRFGVRKVVE